MLFAKRDLIFKTECREFYKNLSVSISWKKEVAKSRVNGVEIEFDGMTRATILEILGNSGLCDYIEKIFVMKNLVPRFGKKDVTSFMDLTYMEYLLTRRKINLPRVIIRHMAYVINVPNHELPYGELLTRIFEAFHVPLNHKKGEDPKRYDYFEETFLIMCSEKD
ncbi:hypothetical protein Dimus_007832 [Dionaea muscipula]